MTRTLLFALALLGPLLVLGGVTEEGVIVAAVLVAAVTVAVRLWGLRPHRALGVRLASGALWALAGFSLLQLVPLPARVLGIISPHALSVWSEADISLGRETGLHPITLDLHATTFAAVSAVIVAGFYDACSALAARSAGRLSLARAVAAAVVAIDIIALAHPLFGLTKLFGFYAPLASSSHAIVLAPLLNPNHLSALAGVGTALLVGIALEAQTAGLRVLALAGAGGSAAIALMTLSRGGMVVIGFELVAMAAYAVSRRGPARSRANNVVLPVAAAVGALAAAVYVAFEPISREVHDTNVGKLGLIRQAAHMISDFPVTGVGRGAFTSTFPAYEGAFGGLLRFTHVENWAVQLAVDVGLPLALAFVGILLFTVGRASPTATARPVTFASLIALVGLSLHDLADFATAFVGMAMVAAALLALVSSTVPTSSPPISREPSARFRFRRVRPFATIAAVLLAPLLLVRHWHHDIDEDTARFADAMRAGTLVDQTSALRNAVARHPAEPYFPMLEGIMSIKTPAAAPHFLRAIKLGPYRPAPHYWLARWFVSIGRRGQAWAEYREAVRLSPAFANVVLDDMIKASAPTEDILVLTEDPAILDVAARLLGEHERGADAATIDDVLIARFPPAIGAWVRKVQRAEASGAHDQARAWAEHLVEQAPNDARSYLALARLLQGEAAEQVLERGVARLRDEAQLLQALIRLRGIRLGLGAVSGELERLRATLLATEGHADVVYALQAQIELERGHPAAAVSHYLDAASSCGDCADYLQRAAEIAESDGQLLMAETILRRLLQAHPEIDAYRIGIERVRTAIDKQQHPMGPLP